MTIDPTLIGIGAAILVVILIVYMPVSKRKVNQTIISLVIAVLIFVAAFAFLEIELAIPVGIAVSVVVIAARYILGGIRSAIYTNFTRYLRRDYWQRRIGQGIVGSGRRRRRRDDYSGLSLSCHFERFCEKSRWAKRDFSLRSK